MGCYIGLADRFGVEHPDFRQDKWSCARDFLDALGDCEQASEDWELIRPLDFESAEDRTAQLEANSELFGKMLRELKADPDLWINVSY